MKTPKEKCKYYKNGKCKLANKNSCWEGLFCDINSNCEQPLYPKDNEELCDYYKAEI